MSFILRWTPLLALLILFVSPVFAQTDTDLSVHATADSLIVTIGSETIVVPRDALALLNSPDGYNQDALSLHVALLHGTLTAEEGEPETPMLPLLTAATPLALGPQTAEQSGGDEGHTWEESDLDGRTVVQVLPDIGTRYAKSGGPVLDWEVEVADAGAYFLYVYAAGVNGGNTMWAGTSDNISRADVSKRQELEWVRVGPFSLPDGPGNIEVRGRQDGLYFAAAVVSASPDLTDADLETVLANSDLPIADAPDADARMSQGDSSLPEEFAVHAVYPNPTQGEATARFDLPEPAEVSVEVFDTLGRRVDEQHASMEPGFGRTLSLRSDALSSGVYVVRVTARAPAGDSVGSSRLTVIR